MPHDLYKVLNKTTKYKEENKNCFPVTQRGTDGFGD
jgi:hypothetical protein